MSSFDLLACVPRQEGRVTPHSQDFFPQLSVFIAAPFIPHAVDAPPSSQIRHLVVHTEIERPAVVEIRYAVLQGRFRVVVRGGEVEPFHNLTVQLHDVHRRVAVEAHWVEREAVHEQSAGVVHLHTCVQKFEWV